MDTCCTVPLSSSESSPISWEQQLAFPLGATCPPWDSLGGTGSQRCPTLQGQGMDTRPVDQADPPLGGAAGWGSPSQTLVGNAGRAPAAELPPPRPPGTLSSHPF